VEDLNAVIEEAGKGVYEVILATALFSRDVDPKFPEGREIHVILLNYRGLVSWMVQAMKRAGRRINGGSGEEAYRKGSIAVYYSLGEDFLRHYQEKLRKRMNKRDMVNIYQDRKIGSIVRRAILDEEESQQKGFAYRVELEKPVIEAEQMFTRLCREYPECWQSWPEFLEALGELRKNQMFLGADKGQARAVFAAQVREVFEETVIKTVYKVSGKEFNIRPRKALESDPQEDNAGTRPTFLGRLIAYFAGKNLIVKGAWAGGVTLSFVSPALAEHFNLNETEAKYNRLQADLASARKSLEELNKQEAKGLSCQEAEEIKTKREGLEKKIKELEQNISQMLNEISWESGVKEIVGLSVKINNVCPDLEAKNKDVIDILEKANNDSGFSQEDKDNLERLQNEADAISHKVTDAAKQKELERLRVKFELAKKQVIGLSLNKEKSKIPEEILSVKKQLAVANPEETQGLEARLNVLEPRQKFIEGWLKILAGEKEVLGLKNTLGDWEYKLGYLRDADMDKMSKNEQRSWAGIFRKAGIGVEAAHIDSQILALDIKEVKEELNSRESEVQLAKALKQALVELRLMNSLNAAERNLGKEEAVKILKERLAGIDRGPDFSMEEQKGLLNLAITNLRQEIEQKELGIRKEVKEISEKDRQGIEARTRIRKIRRSWFWRRLWPPIESRQMKTQRNLMPKLSWRKRAC